MITAHFKALRALEAVLRTGNLRKASAELGVTPAAVSQQIRALEAFLGRDLFTRRPHGLEPTEGTRQVQKTLTSAFTMLSNAMSELHPRAGESRLAVTMPKSFAENWFSHRLSEFYQLSRDLDLLMSATNSMVDLRAENFDYAIRYGPEPASDFSHDFLFDDFVGPACSPGFAETHGLAEEAATLHGIPLIDQLGRTPDALWPDWRVWSARFAPSTMDENQLLRFSDLSSGLQAAISGQGLVLCGVVEAFHALKTGMLVMPFGPGRLCRTGYSYHLVTLEGRRLTTIQQTFKAWLLAEAAAFRRETASWVSLNQ